MSTQTAMIAVLNSEELASKLGKKGSATDMTMYNHKVGEKTVTVVSPTKFPEKIQPMLYALYMCDEVILIVDRMNRPMGEAMVAIDLMQKKKGRLILENFLTEEQIMPFIKDTVLERWAISEGVDDPNVMRENLMDKRVLPREGPTRVTIDQSFNVKGVGTVSLGLVDQGVVSRHQELVALPSGRRTVVRSIQVHDTDVEEAGSGSRVGLALKLVEVGDVDRGSVLAPKDVLSAVTELKLMVSVNKFWRDELHDGKGLHVACGMQFMNAVASMEGTLKAGEEGEVTLKIDGKLVVGPDDKPVLVWLESTGPRIVGRGEILS